MSKTIKSIKNKHITLQELSKGSLYTGIFLGIPIAWPSPPYYIFALLIFIIYIFSNPQIFFKLNQTRIFVIYLLVLISLLSNIIGASNTSLIDTSRALTTSLFFLLFIISSEIQKESRILLKGFTFSMLILAILILLLSMLTGITQQGIYLFTQPEFRLWGQPYFPDWPNYLAFMLSLSFMLNIFIFRQNFLAFIQIAAALLTTSRTPLLALILSVIAMFFMKGKYRIMGVVLLLAMPIILLNIEINDQLLERAMVSSDREDIYGFSINLFLQSPLIGHGSVLLDDSIGFYGHSSFHNSYLDILVRHGLISLLFFLYLLTPSQKNIKDGGLPFLMVILFFLIGSLFQNYLKHPHIVLLFIVIINSGRLFVKNESEN